MRQCLPIQGCCQRRNDTRNEAGILGEDQVQRFWHHETADDLPKQLVLFHPARALRRATLAVSCRLLPRRPSTSHVATALHGLKRPDFGSSTSRPIRSVHHAAIPSGAIKFYPKGPDRSPSTIPYVNPKSQMRDTRPPTPKPKP